MFGGARNKQTFLVKVGAADKQLVVDAELVGMISSHDCERQDMAESRGKEVAHATSAAARKRELAPHGND